MLDACYEAAKGDAKIGTTGKGIGPTYTDKVGRGGLRVGDLLHDFDKKYAKKRKRHLEILAQYNFDTSNLEAIEKVWFEGVEKLKQFEFIDSEHVINKAIKTDKKILAEGAQGTMLDIDFGSYPFVTSSNTISAGDSNVGPENIIYTPSRSGTPAALAASRTFSRRTRS